MFQIDGKKNTISSSDLTVANYGSNDHNLFSKEKNYSETQQREKKGNPVKDLNTELSNFIQHKEKINEDRLKKSINIGDTDKNQQENDSDSTQR